MFGRQNLSPTQFPLPHCQSRPQKLCKNPNSSFQRRFNPPNNCYSPFPAPRPRLLKHHVGIWEPHLKQIVLIKIVISSPERCKLLKSCQEGEPVMESSEQLQPSCCCFSGKRGWQSRAKCCLSAPAAFPEPRILLPQRLSSPFSQVSSSPWDVRGGIRNGRNKSPLYQTAPQNNGQRKMFFLVEVNALSQTTQLCFSHTARISGIFVWDGPQLRRIQKCQCLFFP